MTEYKIQPGDTLAAIAKKFLGDAGLYQMIADANDISDPGNIQVGQLLSIPDLPANPADVIGDFVESMELDVSLEQLKEIMPTGKEDTLNDYVKALNLCLKKYQINTALRICHFLAQIAHESGAFKFVKENLNYSANALRAVFGKYFPDSDIAEEYARQPEKIANRVYANRMGNGDEESGEGWKYRGRGLIQLTGKNNYQQYSDENNIDVISEPDQVADDPILAIDVAGWYWNSRQLNHYADADDMETITKRINGGLNGIDDRREYLQRAKAVLLS